MQLRFSSIIRVVPLMEFQKFPLEELRRKGQSVDAPWSHKESITGVKEGITTGAFNCNAGGVQNGEHLAMFHLNSVRIRFKPEDKNSLRLYTWKETAQAMEALFKKLQNEGPKARAFLTGGQRDANQSPELKQGLIRLFEKLDIPFSILWGQINGPTDVHYDIETDTWTVNAALNSLFDEKKDIKDLNGLKNTFAQIMIEKGDQLFIGDQEIPAKKAKQTYTPRDLQIW